MDKSSIILSNGSLYNNCPYFNDWLIKLITFETRNVRRTLTSSKEANYLLVSSSNVLEGKATNENKDLKENSD